MYEIFERLLKEKGYRVVDVCKATGISQSTLSNWKKRRNMLAPNNLKLIADFLGVTLDYMMGSDDIDWNPKTQEITKSPVSMKLVTMNNMGVGYGNNVNKEDVFYVDEETANTAIMIKNSKNLQMLFDAAKDSSPEDLQTVHEMLMALKRKEQRNSD